MVLKKPPIVEMWVEFKFTPPPNNEIRPIISFLQEYKAEYPRLEVSQEDQLEFRQVSPTKLPEVVSRRTAIKHLRAQDEEGVRWLHLTPTQLVCNFLRLGEEYPGFDRLCQAALEKL